MEIQEFDIIESNNKQELKKMVNDKIIEGWIPCGLFIDRVISHPVFPELPVKREVLYYSVSIYKNTFKGGDQNGRSNGRDRNQAT